MRTIEDSFEHPPRGRLLSAATHPYSRPHPADSCAAIRKRLAAVAADLRQMALNGHRAKDELFDLACKLDAMATEENVT